MGAGLTMIGRHCRHLARDGREHAIKVLDARNAPRASRGRCVEAETSDHRQPRQQKRQNSRLNNEAL
jgi:hypothetical protein